MEPLPPMDAEVESLFRAANERLDEGRDDDVAALRSYLCECSRPTCVQRVAVHPAEYDAVRASGRRFVVAPGHVARGELVVLDRTPRYQVVEKTAEEGAIAEELDPRA